MQPIVRYVAPARTHPRRATATLLLGAMILAASCSSESATTVQVTHKATLPQSTAATEATPATTPGADGEAGRLIPISSVDFNATTLQAACAGPPELVEFADGKAATRTGDVAIWGQPVYGDITGDAVDDAVIVLKCSDGSPAVTTLFSTDVGGRVSIALPLPSLELGEHPFPTRPTGDGEVELLMATISEGDLVAAIEGTTRTTGDDATEATDGTDSTDLGETTSTAADVPPVDPDPVELLPDGATPTRTITFKVDATQVSLVGEEAIAGASTTKFEITDTGLGVWKLGAPRDEVVSDLLERDPATIELEALPPCLSDMESGVQSGPITLGFSGGALAGLWVDLTFGTTPPVDVYLEGQPLDQITFDALIATGIQATITTETDGTRLVSLPSGTTPRWAVADADGYVVGAGLASEPCAVTG